MSNDTPKSPGNSSRGPSRRGPRSDTRASTRGGAGKGPGSRSNDRDRTDKPRGQKPGSQKPSGQKSAGTPGGRGPKGRPPRSDQRRPDQRRPDQRRGPAPAPVADGPDWLYGVHAVHAALRNPKRRILRVIATEKSVDTIAESARQRGLQIEKADARELDRMFPIGAVHQGLALRVAPLPEPVLADIVEQTKAAEEAGETLRPVVILDQVTDPQNVGAVLRSAAVFGARAVIVTRRNSPPVTGALAKAASGAVEQMPLVQVPNVAQAIAVLQAEGWFAVGLEGTGDKSLAQMDLTGKIAIVMGAEGSGLRRLTAERCDLLARIPGEPGFASLNVSNATAVALYEICRQRS